MRSILITIVAMFWISLGFSQDLQVAKIGDFKTESGAVITDAKIGYRTIGTLNAKKDNAILWPTWFTGTSAQIIEFGMLDNIIEKEGLYLILVDALGNGVSSSPSNTPNFPDISIRDMVNSQHKLLAEHLGIKKLSAVMGISMGGMQTYEWLVAYPGFMEKAVNIIGTPKQSFYDVLFWNTQAKLLEKALNHQEDLNFAEKRVMDMFTINLYTPEYLVNNVKTEEAADFMNKQYASMIDPHDYLVQLKAMIGHDIYQSSKLSEEEISSGIKTKMLVVVNKQDHMVNPTNSISLAKNLKSKLKILNTESGHMASFFDHGKIKKEVAPFLAK